MKSLCNLNLRLIVLMAAAILTMGCNVCLAKNDNKQKTENAKVKNELRAGSKYLVNTPQTPITKDYNAIVKYHKARTFGDMGTMLNLENKYSMSYLHKGDIVTMESPGSIYSQVRTSSGFSGWVETEYLSFYCKE